MADAADFFWNRTIENSMFRHSFTLICAAALLAVVTAAPIAVAASLITSEEAALPPQKGAVPNSARGITRGPKIVLPEPEAGVQLSPMRFQVKFQTFGGSSIDLDALKVSYLKSPVVDLTSRIKPFATSAGIDMPDAQVPPGEHLVRVEIKDAEGRTASTSFLLKIAP
jgi:hypothetical protein